jgi:hypothetical protein
MKKTKKKQAGSRELDSISRESSYYIDKAKVIALLVFA